VTGAVPHLPTLDAQAERLIELGAHEIGGLSAGELRAAVSGVHVEDALLVMHPDRAPASALAHLLEHAGKAGFVVVDMLDVDDFVPIESVRVPADPVYLITKLDRGDLLANWTPDEALPAITATGRTPLTVTEAMHWLFQRPEVLERNHCFMTIGSRRRKPDGTLDSRTPALWISNGAGRDGRERRHAPKVGWCWAGNRHTWLGIASAADRNSVSSVR
jgi:hypothetical protein